MDLISTKENRPKQTLPNQTYLTKLTKFYQPNPPKPNQTQAIQTKKLDLACPFSVNFISCKLLFSQNCYLSGYYIFLDGVVIDLDSGSSIQIRNVF